MDFKEFIENCKKEVFAETSIDELTEDAEFKYFDEWIIGISGREKQKHMQKKTKHECVKKPDVYLER